MDQEMDSAAKRQKPTTRSDFGPQPSEAWEIFKSLFWWICWTRGDPSPRPLVANDVNSKLRRGAAITELSLRGPWPTWPTRKMRARPLSACEFQ